MNPANRKSPSDNAKFREAYLANLQLQASNNQKNQNANIIFKQTGAPPPTLPDYRTTTDKFADIEGLKVLLRGKLQGITDGTVASQIAFSLNEDQLRFAVNAWDIIEKDMKSKFALGVPAPVFTAYLNRLMTAYQNNNYAELGLSGNTPSSSLVLYSLKRADLLNAITNILEKGGTKFGVYTKDIIDDINYRINFLRHLLQLFPQLDEETRDKIKEPMDFIYRQQVPDSELPAFITDLELAISRNDKRSFEAEFRRIRGHFEITPDQRQAIFNISEIINPHQTAEIEDLEKDEEIEHDRIPQNDMERPLPPTPGPEEPIFPERVPASQHMSLEKYSERKLDKNGNPRKAPNGENLYALGREGLARTLNEALLANKEITVRSRTPYSSGGKEGQTVVFGAGAMDRPKGGWRPAMESGGKAISGVSGDAYVELYADFLRQIQGKTKEPEEEKQKKKTKIVVEDEEEEEEEKEGGGGGGGGGQGEGLRRRKPKMKGRGIAHLAEKEYEKPKIYSQFGRYFINKPKLIHSGIMALRLPSGNFVPNFPTQKVSLALKEILSHLVNGSQPTYEAVSKMTDDDRDKLVDICRTCHIDMPSIPKSKKMDKDEQDDYRFEVLRGEIMAGNNSPVIVKEFKSLLLKFSRNGKLPKREAHEILEELASMGF